MNTQTKLLLMSVLLLGLVLSSMYSNKPKQEYYDVEGLKYTIMPTDDHAIMVLDSTGRYIGTIGIFPELDTLLTQDYEDNY